MTPSARLQAHPSAVIGRAVMAILVAVAVWLLAGMQLAYWGARIWGQTAAVVPPPLTASVPEVDAARIARTLGAGQTVRVADPAAPVASVGGWRVLGLIATDDGAGAVLLARNGEPPRAYRAGAVLDDGLRVLRIEKTDVWLRADGGDELRISLAANGS